LSICSAGTRANASLLTTTSKHQQGAAESVVDAIAHWLLLPQSGQMSVVVVCIASFSVNGGTAKA